MRENLSNGNDKRGFQHNPCRYGVVSGHPFPGNSQKNVVDLSTLELPTLENPLKTPGKQQFPWNQLLLHGSNPKDLKENDNE